MRMLHRTEVALAFGLALVVVSAGCAKSVSTITKQTTAATTTTTSTSSTTTTTAAATTKTTSIPITITTTKPYGKLTIALVSFSGEKFDPVATESGGPGKMLGPILDYMFLMNKRGGEQLPGVVEKWQLAPDNLSWTYYIRKGIKFHDSSDLTAKDVKFSIEQYMRPTNNYYSDTRNAVDRIELIDDYTLRIYTKGPQYYLPRTNSPTSPAQGMVMPKDYIEKNGWDQFLTRPIGSGPYKFVNRVLGDSVRYEALDSNWRRTAAFKDLSTVLMPEETTRIAALKTGEADVIDGVGLKNSADLRTIGFSVLAVDLASSLVQFHAVYETRAANMPTANIKVRQALSMAINRDEIIKTLYSGLAERPLTPYFSGPSSDFDAVAMQAYCDKVYRYDPTEAERLLKEAGYASGFSIKFYAFPEPTAPDNPKMAEIVQAYWKTLGVKADIVPIDGVQYRRWKNKPVNDALVGQASTFTSYSLPPFNLKNHFGSGSGSVFLGDAFPEFDKTIDAVPAEPDPAKRQQLLEKAMKITADSYTAMPIARYPSSAVHGPRVVVDFPTPLANPNLPVSAALMKHGKD